MPSTRAPRNEPVEPVPPARVLITDDGLWRIDLFETGRTEMTARGEIRPYYRAVFVRIADGVASVDCGKFGFDAWVMGHGDRTIQLKRSSNASTWIAVDLAASNFAHENFREPISESFPLSELAKELKIGER